MPNNPQIYIVLDYEGHVEDINVIAFDNKARIEGYEIIKALQDEIEIFESRAKTQLEKCRTAH